jgi:type I restriction enzyme S subunit
MEAARRHHMVNKQKQAKKYKEAIEPQPLPEPFKWSTVTLTDILGAGGRLEASVFNIEGRQARATIQQCKWPVTTVSGTNGLADASHRKRFKRIYVEKSDFPIFQPAQINEIYPKPATYISSKTRTDLANLRVQRGQILLTCSGTIGNCTIVSKTLGEQIFSHDFIRITAKQTHDIGFIYAFLKTKIGNILLNTSNYGAVISHIEPEHLNNLPIPDPPPILKQQIHDLVMSSFGLRDESNDLMDDSQALLQAELKLPNICDFNPKYHSRDLKSFSIRAGQLSGRLEATYHTPLVDVLRRHLVGHAKELTIVGDPQISKAMILPGRFKRVYVEEGQGVTFFSGKNIGELDPSDKKYLAFSQHNKRIREQLTLSENMILVTCSGTVGNIALVPKHWDGWAMTHDIIRLVAASHEMTGYLYAWLASPYGNTLIARYGYGAVVSHIEDHHLAEIDVPLLKDFAVQQSISEKVLAANQKRFEAYELEQKALKIIKEQVLFSKRAV